MSDGTERRQAKRIAIRLPVVYRAPDGTTVRGTTENVSRRGMLIVAKAPPQGTQVRVAVTGADGRDREMVGEVVRATDDGKIALQLTDGAEGVDELIQSQD